MELEPWRPTRRQLEVIWQIRKTPDATYREPADALFVSVNTVKKHLKRIYLELNVHSKCAMINRVRDLG